MQLGSEPFRRKLASNSLPSCLPQAGERPVVGELLATPGTGAPQRRGDWVNPPGSWPSRLPLAAAIGLMNTWCLTRTRGRQVGQEPPPPAFPLCLSTPPQWELYYPLLPDLLPSLSPGGHRSQGTSEFWETLGAAEASGTVWLSSLNLSPQL